MDIKKVQKAIPTYHQYTTFSKGLAEIYKQDKIFNYHIEKFIDFLEISIEHQKRHEAQFVIDDDKIQMPYKCYFRKLSKMSREINYYSTLFHEIIHWSGHRKRLNRSTLINYNNGRVINAVEEITAELGANLLLEFFELQVSPSSESLSLINKELSYFDKEEQEHIYNKASRQANKALRYFIKQFKRYVKECEKDRPNRRNNKLN